MTTETLLLVFIMLAAMGGLSYYLITQLKNLKTSLKGDENQVLLAWLKDMKGSVEKNSEVIEKQLKDSRDTMETQMKTQRDAISQQTKLIWERLDQSQNVIREVQKQLGGIEEFGKDMKDLSNVLKSPKMRGGLGEQFLYDILANYLPADLYKTQYKFKDGNTCDAVVFTDRGMVPIDSKFPMENFKAMSLAENPDARDKCRKLFISDVKKRIDEIASKYILPEEKTTDQAIMYVPSENIYYEIIVNTPEVEDYAKHKNIIMASPNTLSYFMKVLLVAFQQHELTKHTGEILKALDGIKIEAGKFGEELGVVERHIANAHKAMDSTRNRFGKLFGRIENVLALQEPETSDKPLLE